MVRRNETVKCSVLKKLELTAKKKARLKAVRKIATSFDEAYRKRTAELERMVENSNRQLADPKTALRRNGSGKRKKRGL